MLNILKEIYREIFKEDFAYETSQKNKLQCVVYLLENMGINVGDYGFTWSKYDSYTGPYSISLEGDALNCYLDSKKETVNFSDKAEKAFSFIRQVLLEKENYTEEKWLCAIASLHHLKYVLKIEGSDYSIIRELMLRNKHMSNISANRTAMHIATMIEEDI